MGLGEKLRDARRKADLTQSELAGELNVSNTVISNWEKGVSHPSSDSLAALCIALDISADNLLELTLPANDFSSAERTHIHKYRALDLHGRELVDLILEKEYSRCECSSELTPLANPAQASVTSNKSDGIDWQRYIGQPIAARGGGVHKADEQEARWIAGVMENIGLASRNQSTDTSHCVSTKKEKKP